MIHNRYTLYSSTVQQCWQMRCGLLYICTAEWGEWSIACMSIVSAQPPIAGVFGVACRSAGKGGGSRKVDFSDKKLRSITIRISFYYSRGMHRHPHGSTCTTIRHGNFAPLISTALSTQAAHSGANHSTVTHTCSAATRDIQQRGVHKRCSARPTTLLHRLPHPLLPPQPRAPPPPRATPRTRR